MRRLESIRVFSKDLRLGLVLVACGACVTADGTVAALPPQILCNESIVLRATILGGIGIGCAARVISCSPRVSLGVRVQQLLAAKNDPHVYHDGEVAYITVDVAQAQATLPTEPVTSGIGNFIINPRDHPLTVAEVASLFGGKTYIFGLELPSRTLSIPSGVWDLDRRLWIEDTLRRHARYQNDNCPKLLK